MKIEELPFEIQENIREVMNAMNKDEVPEIMEFTVKFEGDLMAIPIDYLASMLRDAVVMDEFEKATEIKKAIEESNYTIDISDKMLTLTYNK